MTGKIINPISISACCEQKQEYDQADQNFFPGTHFSPLSNHNRPAHKNMPGSFIVIVVFYSVQAFSRSFSTLVSFTQSTNTSAAFPSSSGVGKLGAIRILESFGSLPYGISCTCSLSRTTPASFALATIAFAHPVQWSQRR